MEDQRIVDELKACHRVAVAWNEDECGYVACIPTLGVREWAVSAIEAVEQAYSEGARTLELMERPTVKKIAIRKIV